MKEPTFVLIQCRDANDPMLNQEVDCFAKALGLPSDNITAINLPYDTLHFGLLENRDILFVGGAGEFSVLNGHAFLSQFFDFLADVCDIGFPMFASCFGFQALCIALGGTIARDPASSEVGTFDLTLTAEGRADSLFGELPDIFPAQLGHKDSVVQVPSGVINLARSERVICEALKVPDRPIYATQFHPELTRQQNLERFETYIQVYRGTHTGIDMEDISRSFRETEETYSLLSKFVRKILFPNGTK